MPSLEVTNKADGPVAKRQKLEVANGAVASGTTRGSRIFVPYRTVGLVSSTKVPFTSIPLGKTTFQITTSVGRCLQTYDLRTGLHLTFITRPETPEDITATFAWKDTVITAFCAKNNGAKPGIWMFKRGKKLQELEVPEDLNEAVKKILVFGAWIVAICSTRIEVWKSTSFEHYTTLHAGDATTGTPELTDISTMPTFLNKIFVSRKDGKVDIWNVSTGKLKYTILPPTADCGAVTAIQPTPAYALMAIAYSKGPLIIHNVRTDRTVLLLHSDSLVTSISFRTDGMGAGEDGRKAGVMATAGPETGDATFWDLNKGGRLMGVLRGAHNPPHAEESTVGGGISKVEFLPGQPVVVTSGLDNSLKSWIFDETPFSPVPRILHSRSGHSAPVTRLQFLPSDSEGAESTGKWFLSAGKDRSLWGWSLRRDGQSTELSQGNVRKKAKKLGILASSALPNEPSTTLEDLKAPEITCIASSLNRDGGMGAFAGDGKIWQKGHQRERKPEDATLSGNTGWESVVTGHRGDKYARTWFWGRKKAGRWALETSDGGNVSSVAVSPCGTFAVIGSETGGIDMYNLQSGQHRQRFPAKLTPAQAKKLKAQALAGTKPARFQPGLGKHTKAVTGIVVDSLNKTLITVALDGKVKFWNFQTGNLVDELNWHPMTAITGIKYHAASDMIALACDDMSIRIVDIETKRTIREFWGSQGGINDFCFSNDGRWIIAASGDRVIRVWDLPTGHLIDGIRTASPCTALSFSPTGEFLAAACEGQLGVNIWNNKTLFKHVPTRHISEREIADVTAPTVSGEGGQGLIEAAFEDDRADGDDEGTAPVESLEQLSKDMLTLSLVPKSRWQTLLHLDLIRERNKPKEAPKAPEKAPFFLPSLENAKAVAAASKDEDAQETAAERSRIMKMDRIASEGEFTVTLKEGRDSGDYTPFITHLKTLPPSAADLEIRSLNPLSGSSNELTTFVEALTQRLTQRLDYELVQAWMNVFLKHHGDVVGSDEELRGSLKLWKDAQEREAWRVGELVGYLSGVVGFLRNPRT